MEILLQRIEQYLFQFDIGLFPRNVNELLSNKFKNEKVKRMIENACDRYPTSGKEYVSTFIELPDFACGEIASYLEPRSGQSCHIDSIADALSHLGVELSFTFIQSYCGGLEWRDFITIANMLGIRLFWKKGGNFYTTYYQRPYHCSYVIHGASILVANEYLFIPDSIEDVLHSNFNSNDKYQLALDVALQEVMKNNINQCLTFERGKLIMPTKNNRDWKLAQALYIRMKKKHSQPYRNLTGNSIKLWMKDKVTTLEEKVEKLYNFFLYDRVFYLAKSEHVKVIHTMEPVVNIIQEVVMVPQPDIIVPEERPLLPDSPYIERSRVNTPVMGIKTGKGYVYSGDQNTVPYYFDEEIGLFYNLSEWELDLNILVESIKEYNTNIFFGLQWFKDFIQMNMKAVNMGDEESVETSVAQTQPGYWWWKMHNKLVEFWSDDPDTATRAARRRWIYDIIRPAFKAPPLLISHEEASRFFHCNNRDEYRNEISEFLKSMGKKKGNSYVRNTWEIIQDLKLQRSSKKEIEQSNPFTVIKQPPKKVINEKEVITYVRKSKLMPQKKVIEPINLIGDRDALSTTFERHEMPISENVAYRNNVSHFTQCRKRAVKAVAQGNDHSITNFVNVDSNFMYHTRYKIRKRRNQHTRRKRKEGYYMTPDSMKKLRDAQFIDKINYNEHYTSWRYMLGAIKPKPYNLSQLEEYDFEHLNLLKFRILAKELYWRVPDGSGRKPRLANVYRFKNHRTAYNHVLSLV
jgi:hypothetical protein